MHKVAGAVLILMVAIPASTEDRLGAGSPSTLTLSFEDRVAAQRAIEEVYWRHRIWPEGNPQPKPGLGAVLADERIRLKAEDALIKSTALDVYWSRPITQVQIQAEIDRMVRDTRDPRLLRELFEALHQDPLVIAECLARPALADRLLRSWYARDERFHGELRRSAEQSISLGLRFDGASVPGGEVQEVTWKRFDGDAGEAEGSVRLGTEEWNELRSKLEISPGLTAPHGALGALQETEDSFYAIAVLAEGSDWIRTRLILWRKMPFDAWWQERRNGISPAPADVPTAYEVRSPEVDDCAADTWRPTSGDVPEPDFLPTTVWSGTEMIIFGASGTSAYDPATDTWRRLGTGPGFPGLRSFGTGVWTGTEMIVWGGSPQLATGGRYNPVTDSWSPTSTGAGAPSGRKNHTAVWTGSRMIVWGGMANSTYLDSGGVYDPSTNSWTATSRATGVPSPRYYHTAVWTGSEMIIWGGLGPGGTDLKTGARYNPVTDSWIPTSTGANVPTPRSTHTAVWTGSLMLIWGGGPTGARYSPSSDAWTPISTSASVPARSYHTALWTGSEMIVWGGGNNSCAEYDGARYNPASNTWIAIPAGANAPLRMNHVAVWTGNEMIVWSGDRCGILQNTGARYQPSTNSWIPMSQGTSPIARYNHTAVWTGAEMVVWGGNAATQGVNTGGRYYPATDTWSATASAGAPTPRYFHTAIWTGQEAILWGGYYPGHGYENTGGRYDPSSDRWTATSVGANVPLSREYHTAVWTGSQMIIWGGDQSGDRTNTGGRYNPASDTWTPTAIGGAIPSARDHHTAVWTGGEMIVWGGNSGQPTYPSTGGLYNPTTDTWVATASNPGVPAARVEHTAIWTGSQMLVWGGKIDPSSGALTNTGGFFDPIANRWTAMSVGANVPTARSRHIAIWAGDKMIVWGGSSPFFNTGGLYDPVQDTWTPTGLDSSVPRPRSLHTAVWTGREMIVWGGFSGASGLASGGRYCHHDCNLDTWYRDADSDGHGVAGDVAYGCSAPNGYVGPPDDCDDSDPTIHPGASDANCNGTDDDCDVAIDEDYSAVSTVCGTGTCTRNGTTSCVAGHVLDSCTPGSPSPESCNGDDDDCNGATDDSGDSLCNDANPCTDDACGGAAGCVHVANAVPCDDGNACTASDVCAGGTCAGTPANEPQELGATLRVDKNGTGLLITWQPPSSADTTSLLRGLLEGLPVGSGSEGETCLADRVGLPSSSWTDTDDVVVGHGSWYLVRAENACGVGGYGHEEVNGVPSREEESPTCP